MDIHVVISLEWRIPCGSIYARALSWTADRCAAEDHDSVHQELTEENGSTCTSCTLQVPDQKEKCLVLHGLFTAVSGQSVPTVQSGLEELEHFLHRKDCRKRRPFDSVSTRARPKR